MHTVFKRKIDASRVRIGDVPIGYRWKGLTEKEVQKIKKKGNKITIKEGVRFAPVFVITIILTILFGNLLFIFI